MAYPRHIILLLGMIAGGLFLSVAAPAAPLATTAPSATAATTAKPSRIVSLNVCTDQILMQLVAPGRIKSVTYVAADPRASALAERAGQFHHNYGAVEEILPFEPDLVLAGQYTTRAAVTLLKRLNYHVVELPVAYTLDGIRRNVRIIADVVGEPEKGAEILRAFDKDVGAAPAEPDRQAAPVAALYWANSYSSGLGTLADTVIRHAGFRTLSDTLGFKGAGYVPMEALLQSRPDVLVVGMMRPSEALAQQIFRHPAMLKAFASHRKVMVPDRYWTCGTPFTARAIQQLRTLRQRMEHSQ